MSSRKALFAAGLGVLLLLASDRALEAASADFPIPADQTVLAYRASGGLAGLDEELIVTHDGIAWATRRSGGDLQSAHARLAPLAVVGLQTAFTQMAAGALSVDDCKQSPPNSPIYTLSGWADGDYTLRRSCAPSGLFGTLARDAQVLLGAILEGAGQHAKVLEIVVEQSGLDPIQPVWRGLTIYRDGTVLTWSRNAQGAMNLRVLDHRIDAGLLEEVLQTLLAERDAWQGGASGPSPGGSNGGSKGGSGGGPRGGSNGGSIQVRLFDAGSGGAAFELDPSQMAENGLLAHLLEAAPDALLN